MAAPSLEFPISPVPQLTPWINTCSFSARHVYRSLPTMLSTVYHFFRLTFYFYYYFFYRLSHLIGALGAKKKKKMQLAFSTQYSKGCRKIKWLRLNTNLDPYPIIRLNSLTWKKNVAISNRNE